MIQLKQKIILGALIISFISVFAPILVSAEMCGDVPLEAGQSCCAGVPTSLIDCSDAKGENGIYKLLFMGINILTGLIMVAAIGGFIYSAVLYTTAGGNAEGIKKAKSNMVNIVIGILAYALMYSFLNYLIPGGFLNGFGAVGVKSSNIAVIEDLK